MQEGRPRKLEGERAIFIRGWVHKPFQVQQGRWRLIGPTDLKRRGALQSVRGCSIANGTRELSEESTIPKSPDQ